MSRRPARNLRASTRHPERMDAGGSSAETHCTIVTLDESPKQAGLVWVGTDDGKLWLTRDAGKSWTDLTRNLRGVPAGLYVSRVEASHHDAGTAYVAIDGHRSDVFRPFLLKTRDFGRTWTSIVANLPAHGPVKVVRESPGNPGLLFAGTEFGLFASLDGGARWLPFGAGLPTVAVDDLLIHPRDRDLIVGTHGRSVYIVDDVTPLERWTAAAAREPVTLFQPRPAHAFLYRPMSGNWGQRRFSADNPKFGAYLNYFVREWDGEKVSIEIVGPGGRTVRKLDGPGTPGFHRVVWDLSGEPRERIDNPEWSDQPQFVPAGTYTVKLTYGKHPKQEQPLVVEVEPGTMDP